MVPEVWDAHCHLQDERIPASEVAALLADAQACGVSHVAVNGCWPGDWPRVLQLAATHPGTVLPQLGMHPWWVGRRTADWLQQLRRLLQENPGVGVGEVRAATVEATGALRPQQLVRRAALRAGPQLSSTACCVVQCGLDKGPRMPEGATFEDQEGAFQAQLRLAQELGRPVSVHCVRAYDAVLSTLVRLSIDVPVVLHAWTGSAEITAALLRLPNVSFSLSGHLGKLAPRKALPMLRSIPLDRLLLESDSPDGALCLNAAWLEALPSLAALPERLQRFQQGCNTPAAVACNLTLVAAARGESEAAVAAASCSNAKRIFCRGRCC